MNSFALIHCRHMCLERELRCLLVESAVNHADFTSVTQYPSSLPAHDATFYLSPPDRLLPSKDASRPSYLPHSNPLLRRQSTFSVKSRPNICPGLCPLTNSSIPTPAVMTAICGVTPHPYIPISTSSLPLSHGRFREIDSPPKTQAPPPTNKHHLRRPPKIHLINIPDPNLPYRIPRPSNRLAMHTPILGCDLAYALDVF